MEMASGTNLEKEIKPLIAEYCPRLSVGKNHAIRILSARSVTPSTDPSELLCLVRRKKCKGDTDGLKASIRRFLLMTIVVTIIRYEKLIAKSNRDAIDMFVTNEPNV